MSIDWKPIETVPRHDADEIAQSYLFYDKSINFIFQGWADPDGGVWASGAPFDSAANWEPTHWAFMNAPEGV